MFTDAATLARCYPSLVRREVDPDQHHLRGWLRPALFRRRRALVSSSIPSSAIAKAWSLPADDEGGGMGQGRRGSWRSART